MRLNWRYICAAWGLVALYGFGGVENAGAKDVGVWVTGPSLKVLRTETPPANNPIFNAKTKTVSLYAARNEFVSFQIVFSGAFSKVNMKPFTLKGPKGTVLDKVELFREHYLKHVTVSQIDGKKKVVDCVAMDNRRKSIGAPMEYPVQMVPLHAKKYGAPFNVKPKMNEVIWADIFIPEKTPAGNYTGTVLAGGAKLKIKLTVWNFTLPSVSHFPNWVYVGPEEIAYSFNKGPSDIRNMMPTFDQYFQMGHNHRVALMESIENGLNYMKAPDRKFYDYYTGKAFKGDFAPGFGYELLPLGGDVSSFTDALKKEGWLNRAFVYLADEPGSKDAYQNVLNKGKRVRETTGGQIMRMITEQFTPSKPDWPHLDTEVDIFCSGGTPPGQVPEVEKKGNVVWTYNGGYGGSALTDSPGPALRSQAWAGFVSGSRAWFFWEGVYVVDKHNKWKKERRKIRKNPAKYRTDVWNVALNFDEATKPWRGGKLYPAGWALRLNGDGLLFYPGMDVGIDGPIGCFRLKNLRRGSQDFEYLYLLEKMGKKAAALAEAKKVLGGTGGKKVTSSDGQFGKKRFNYSHEGAAWDAARITLGKLLDKIGEKALRAKIKPYNQYPNPVGHADFYGGKRY